MVLGMPPPRRHHSFPDLRRTLPGARSGNLLELYRWHFQIQVDAVQQRPRDWDLFASARAETE
jgi:hypothetical protein